jgi:hypothetical protein
MPVLRNRVSVGSVVAILSLDDELSSLRLFRWQRCVGVGVTVYTSPRRLRAALLEAARASAFQVGTAWVLQ